MKSQKGVSLLELLIVMGLSSFGALGVAKLTENSTKAANTVAEVVAVNQEMGMLFLALQDSSACKTAFTAVGTNPMTVDFTALPNAIDDISLNGVSELSIGKLFHGMRISTLAFDRLKAPVILVPDPGNPANQWQRAVVNLHIDFVRPAGAHYSGDLKGDLSLEIFSDPAAGNQIVACSTSPSSNSTGAVYRVEKTDWQTVMEGNEEELTGLRVNFTLTESRMVSITGKIAAFANNNGYNEYFRLYKEVGGITGTVDASSFDGGGNSALGGTVLVSWAGLLPPGTYSYYVTGGMPHAGGGTYRVRVNQRLNGAGNVVHDPVQRSNLTAIVY